MITIGTDCSGIEAPIEALKQLGIPFQHKWSCEIDKFARQSILANYHPEIIYEDITTRDHSQLPAVDIYVCGFPCQSFSLMGKKLGTQDPRSNVMLHCIDVIKKKRPPVFILENVKNFKYIEEGRPYNHLINELSGITNEDEEPFYNIYADIYNTKDYGIPQNRERLYVIGISKYLELEDYIKPQSMPMKLLDDFLLDRTVLNSNICDSLLNNYRKIKRISSNDHYIITPFTFSSIMNNIVPTLTVSGCKYMFHCTYNRYLSAKECLLLQGFPVNFNNIVGDVKLCRQIGNSMSVNVLKAIYKQIFDVTLIQFI